MLMSRKDEIGLYGQADLLHTSGGIRSQARRSRDAIRNKGALRGLQPEREEYILALLVGISADQTRMWPEIVRLLEDAQAKDWSRPMVVVPPDGDPKKIGVRTFGTFEAVYAEFVEPWLGSWAELRATYARFRAGEISEQQGREEIQARVAAAALAEDNGKVLPEGRPKRSSDETASGKQLTQAERAGRKRISRSTQQRLDAIARKRPDLLAEIAAKRLTVREAARTAGIERQPDLYEQLLRLWGRLDPEQRARFEAYLQERRTPERRAAFVADHADELRRLLDGPRP
jgi:hypothetical protein